MKLKKIFLFASVAVTMLFASCSDDDGGNGRGKWDAVENYANLYFATSSDIQEVDPNAPTVYTFEVIRRDSLRPALIATPTVIVNTDDVFDVSDAVFEEGDSVATITVKYDRAEVGKPYTLKIIFDDPALTSSYSDDIIYTYKVTRVKWNPVAVGTYTYSQFFTGDDEGLILYQRDDVPTLYKITDWGYGVDFAFTMNKDNEISFDEFFIGYDHPSYGEVWAYDMYPLSSDFEIGYYADGVFHFQIGYHVEAGWFGYGEEIFTITDKIE